MFTLKRSIKRFLCTIFTIHLLAAAASAQDCETYDLYGAVTDEAGKAVKGAFVEILDVQTKELIKPSATFKVVPKVMSGSDGRYVVSILGLPNIQNGQDFILRVSKSGFIAHKEKINIYLCGFKRDVRMVAHMPNNEKGVRQAVEAFYAAFNAHGFGRATEFTTEDWNHINPFGGWTRGREAVLKELKEVHSTFLKGVSDTIEHMSVRFATADVAVVTVTSRIGAYTTPDGVKHEDERHIRTFVVVKHSGRWLIMQDQNTKISR